MKKAKDVDEYIAGAPEDIKDKLSQLRKIIKDSTPGVIEKISYGMPYYGYKGRLAYFAVYKNHIGLYLTPPIIEKHKNDLKGYITAKATVQFPNKNELPVALIKKLIKARVKLNNENNKQ